MIEVNTVVLENGNEYVEVDSLVYANEKYLLFSNVKNVKDFCIRKLEITNNKEFLVRLDAEEEFEIVLDLFMKKNKALFI